MAKKVRAGSKYIFHACLLDRIDGRTGLEDGTLVKVIEVPGCPPAGTMGHCYVGDPDTGKFISMVATGSLNTKAEYAEYLRAEIAKTKKALGMCPFHNKPLDTQGKCTLGRAHDSTPARSVTNDNL